jgi:hypothetical protein
MHTCAVTPIVRNIACHACGAVHPLIVASATRTVCTTSTVPLVRASNTVSRSVRNCRSMSSRWSKNGKRIASVAETTAKTRCFAACITAVAALATPSPRHMRRPNAWTSAPAATAAHGASATMHHCCATKSRKLSDTHPRSPTERVGDVSDPSPRSKLRKLPSSNDQLMEMSPHSDIICECDSIVPQSASARRCRRRRCSSTSGSNSLAPPAASGTGAAAAL